MAPKKTKPGKNSGNSYTISGTDITLRSADCVFMKPANEDEPPYIARVEKLVADEHNNMEVKIRWYYRPEDTNEGRMPFHGEKELFLGNAYDVQSVDTIQGKCNVHSYEDYLKLKCVEIEDYFCRYQYDVPREHPASDQPLSAGERFTPQRVAVYCKCSMPYNPDHDMVQCDECKDWYHLHCVDLSVEDVRELDEFFCFKCVS